MKDTIQGGGYLDKYFTQFPNMIDDSDLTVYEFRVLLHYYRVRNCWEGIRTTAKRCKISPSKIAEVRKSLVQKGFIELEELNDGGVNIIVVDKNQENMNRYSGGVPPQGQPRTATKTPPVLPGGHKNNQLRITKEEQAPLFFNEQTIIDKLNAIKAQFGIPGISKLTPDRKRLIHSRIKETGAILFDIEEMIRHRCKQWKGTEFEKYIRIETLFRASKFTGYMEEAAAQPAKDWTESKAYNPGDIVNHNDTINKISW